ncbi:MAG: flippase-like domain-containing protein [Planctomycetaceae bacterium]|nr:flippase-like domain-containing protein [Planctomycetaceae bacterium]
MKWIRILVDPLRRHWVWIKWVAAIAILTWLFRQNRATLRQIDWHNLDWSFFAVGVVLTGVAFLITFTRWYYLVVSQGLPFTWRDAVRLGFIGILFNYVAPGAAGGDIVKALLIAKEHPERKAVAAATVFLDRLLGLIALFCVGAVASLAFLPLTDYPRLQMLLSVLWAGTLGGLVGLFLLLHTSLPQSRLVAWMFKIKFVGPILEEIQRGILMYQSRKRVLWGAVGLSVIGHFAFLTVFYCASLALESGPAAPSFIGHLFLIPAAELVGVLIPTPAGIGALEGAVQGVFVMGNEMAAHPVEKELAAAAGFSVALVFRLTNMMTALIGGAFYLSNRREIEEVLEEEEHLLEDEQITD